MPSELQITCERGLMHYKSIEAGRQMQPCNWKAGPQDGLWHCVLTATPGCIDTFYSATCVTNLGARIDCNSDQWWFSRVKTECWYTVLHMETHGPYSFTSLYILYIARFSFHFTFSDQKKRTFKTRIKCHRASHPVRPHANREHLFTDVELSAATLGLKEKVSEKGKPPCQTVCFHQRTERILFSDWQIVSRSIFFSLWEKIIHFLWHREIPVRCQWNTGLTFTRMCMCVLTCVSKGCTHFPPGLYHHGGNDREIKACCVEQGI